jgi:sugar phosphate isomerase/epimerase
MKESPVGWDRLLPDLRRRGYQGFISLEGIAEPKLQCIENEVKWFRSLMAR